MMTGDAMVAVVRALGDAELAVTVRRGNNQYTLIPNTYLRKDSPQRLRNKVTDRGTVRCDSTVQADDDRYITTYQTEHCSRRPSSPPVQLSEFPPQRPVLSPGHGNFEVGGTGSGEKYASFRNVPSFRDGMNWPDRGCVCSPRGSYEANAFADSLRKYPSLSPDRSAEIVEGLVNYKNGLKYQSQRNQKPARLSNSYLIETGADARPHPCKAYFKNGKLEEPTARKGERSGRQELTFPREYDIRFLRDISARAKNYAKIVKSNCATCSNTESQATVQMVSREVATTPKPTPSRRTIAIPFTPSCSAIKIEGQCNSSCSAIKIEGQCNYLPRHNYIRSAILSTVTSPKLVDSVSSYVELDKYTCKVIGDSRRIKSQEEVRITDITLENTSEKELTQNLSACVKSSYLYDDLTNKKIKYKSELIKSNVNKIDGVNNDNKIDEKRIVHRPLVISECELYYIIKSWLSNFSLRDKDILGRHINKNSILKAAARDIKELIRDKNISDDELKCKILNIIQNMPLKRFCNLKCYKNKLISILFDNVVHTLDEKYIKIDRQNINCTRKSLLTKRKRSPIITESSLKNLIGLTLDDFFEGTNVAICKNLLHIIKYELVDVFNNSIDSLKTGNNGDVKHVITCILMKCDQLTTEQVVQITNILLNLMDKILIQSSIHSIYTVFPDTNPTHYPVNTSLMNKSDINLDCYAHQLIEQIEEWLNNLNIPHIEDSGLKRLVVYQLANDIIDRQKYLASNPSKIGSEDTELEYLKYQIFKWINKLLGEENIETLKHAQDLMSKIKSLAVPKLTTPQVQLTSSQRSYDKENCRCKIIKYNNNCHNFTIQIDGLIKQINNKYTQSIQYSNEPSKFVNFNHQIAINTAEIENVHRKDTPYTYLEAKQCKNTNNIDISRPFSNAYYCYETSIIQNCDENSSCITPSLKALNEEYDCYLKQWIEEIPISVANPEEEKLAALARLGILHGIWKAIAAIKLDPKVFHNPYHYQDVLDDEVESLFQSLPQTNELVTKKHKLKAQLLEKTLTMNEKMKSLVIPVGFKQQLLESLNNNLPKISKFDPLKEEVEIHKISLIEDYILFIRFKEDDDIKSNIYKNSFLRKIEDLVNSINKNKKGKGVVNPEINESDLITAIAKVPIPDNEKVKDEANDILLGMEISQWLLDVPLRTKMDSIEKRRVRDNLAIKIKEIKSQKDCLSLSTQVDLRGEIRKQLENLSVEVDNVNFVIEELVNRLTNLSKNEIKNKTVSTQEPQDYADFSRHKPACSSFIDAAAATNDGSSYMIIGGDIVRRSSANNLPHFMEPTINEEQWLSMDITKMPPNMWNSFQDESRLGQPRIYTSTINGHQVPGQVTNYPDNISNIPNQAMPFPFAHGGNFQPSYRSHSQIPYRIPSCVEESHYHTQPSLHYSQNELNNVERPQYEYNQRIIPPRSQFFNQRRRLPQNPTSPSSYYGLRYGNGVSNEVNLHPHNSIMKHRDQLTSNDRGKSVPVNSTPLPYYQQFPSNAPTQLPATTAEPSHFLESEDSNLQNHIGKCINSRNSSTFPMAAYANPSVASTSQHIDNKLISHAGGARTGILRNSKIAAPSIVSPKTRNEKSLNEIKISSKPAFHRSTEKEGIKRTIQQNKVKHQRENKDKETVISEPLLAPAATDASLRNVPKEDAEFISSPYIHQPFDYSTPQQSIPGIIPERPRKKYQKYYYFQGSDDVKGHLELGVSDYGSDTEEEEFRCMCMRRHYRLTPRPYYPSCDPYGIPTCLSRNIVRCPYFYF